MQKYYLYRLLLTIYKVVGKNYYSSQESSQGGYFDFFDAFWWQRGILNYYTLFVKIKFSNFTERHSAWGLS